MNPGARNVALLTMSALLAACAGDRAPGPAASPVPSQGPQVSGIQYLYGSAEGAAISRQAWSALVDHVAAGLGGKDRRSVVLAPGATLDAPAFLPCAGKPPAAIFDVDETLLLNVGFEADAFRRDEAGFDQARWERWERTGAAAVAPTPGAKEAIDRLHAMGITVFFNTNRSAANAAFTEQAVDGAGLGPAIHGKTLFLMGDDATGSHKDARRARIAAHYCVIAMGGDQLTDFSDLFSAGATAGVAARRAATALPGIAAMWGHGWFVLPNPVYGAGLRGGFDDIFPKDKQWRDPADPAPKEQR